MISNKTTKDYTLWKLFPLVVFIFNPKIDIISIPNFWQGIRLDDIIVMFYSILFFVSNKFKIYPNLISSKIFGYNWIIFFPYMVFAIILGKSFGISPQLLIAIRYCEYIALIIILNQLDPPKDKIILLFKIYILLNFVIVMLQYFEILGGLTSRGTACAVHVPGCFDKEDIKSICFLNCDLGFMKNLVHPGDFLNKRVPGITGGPWELSMNLSMCIYGIALFEKKLKRLIPYILLVVVMMLIGQSRGIVFGFLAGSLFLINDYKKAIKLFIMLFIFIAFVYFFNFFNFKEIADNKFLIDYFTLIKIIIGAFTGNLPSESALVGTGLESMLIRATTWAEIFSDLRKSSVLLFFGSGGGDFIYTESFIVRVLSSFGLIGSFIILYMSRKLPLFFISFILVSGITIDVFVSFKIFVFSCLLLMMYKKKENI